MLDAALRPLIDPPLSRLAKVFVAANISANTVTWSGFVIGMLALPLLATQHYGLALVAIALNRLADGLDGAIARKRGMTDYGGYLDISLDFIFYAAVVFGMSLARPDEAIYGAFLLWTFMGTGATFLAYAILAAKHGETTEIRGSKSLYYLGGLAEGTETIFVMVLFCLVPGWFAPICVIFGIMCIITAATRIVAARDRFGKH